MQYIVSGFPRSGTTMMMRCLEAGGLPCVKAAPRNELTKNQNGWQMNPGADLYEVTIRDLQQPWIYEHEKVIKIPVPWLPVLKDIPEMCRVIFMLRDPEEVRQSYRAIFQKDEESKLPDVTCADIVRFQTWGVAEWWRRGAGVIALDYADVLQSSLWHMKFLATNGWPIEPVAAADIVDPDMYRFQRDKLVVGL